MGHAHLFRCLGIAMLLSMTSCVVDKAADHLTQRRRATDGEFWTTRAGLVPRAFSVTAGDGTHLSCLEVDAARGIRRRGTVYLFHGLGNSKEQMLPTARWLSASGFRCIAWDSRGHGASGGTRAGYGTREVGDALAVIAQARKRGSVKKDAEFIWGYSMGTAVALQTLPYLPTVKAGVLLAPMADLGGVVNHQAAGHFHGVLRPLVPLVRARIRSTAGFDPKNIRPVDALRFTDAELLLIHGRNDDVIPVSQSGRLIAAGRPGQVRSIVLEGFSHQGVMWDLPEKIRDEAVRFLESAADGKRPGVSR